MYETTQAKTLIRFSNSPWEFWSWPTSSLQFCSLKSPSAGILIIYLVKINHFFPFSFLCLKKSQANHWVCETSAFGPWLPRLHFSEVTHTCAPLLLQFILLCTTLGYDALVIAEAAVCLDPQHRPLGSISCQHGRASSGCTLMGSAIPWCYTLTAVERSYSGHFS